MTPTPPLMVNAPRRKPGRGSQVTLDERREIQRMRLIEGLNQRQPADRFGRTRETIAGVLKGEEFERLRAQVEVDLVVTVQRQLKNNVGKAATAWVKAPDRAAQKGDHKVELQHEPFQFEFNGFLKIAFQESHITSGAGLILERRWADTATDRSLRYFTQRFPESEAGQIAPTGTKVYINRDGIRVAPALTLLSTLV